MGGLSDDSGPLPYEPLEFPTDIPTVSGVRRLTWFIDTAIQTSQSPFTYQRQVFLSSGERWRVTVDLPQMDRARAGQWQGFLMNLRAGFYSVYFGDVMNPNPLGKGFGDPVVNGANQTGKVLLTDGWPPSTFGLLLAGDKLQIGNRLYQTTTNVNSNASGEAPIHIFPTLRESPPDNAPLILNDPKGIFALEAPQLLLSELDINNTYRPISFTLVEDI